MFFENKLIINLSKSLENEIEIDRSIKKAFNIDSELPNFKILKLVNIKNKLGFLFFIFKPMYLLYVFFAQIFYTFQSILPLITFKSKVRIDNTDKLFLLTTQNNKSLIFDAFHSLYSNDETFNLNEINFKYLYENLTRYEILKAIILNTYFIFYIVSKYKFNFEIIANTRDSLFLIIFIIFLAKQKDNLIITDDHYQRWSYLISIYSNNSVIVQHGYISDKISFKNNFGDIKNILLRDLSFKNSFLKYFQLSTYSILQRRLNTISFTSQFTIFLASSSIYVDEEIKFINTLKSIIKDFFLIIKPHPVHVYDDRLKSLISFADMVCEKDINPNCNIFISFASFMEFDYKSISIKTYAIRDFKDNYIELVSLISNEIKFNKNN